jgi:hypothetical protein
VPYDVVLVLAVSFEVVLVLTVPFEMPFEMVLVLRVLNGVRYTEIADEISIMLSPELNQGRKLEWITCTVNVPKRYSAVTARVRRSWPANP